MKRFIQTILLSTCFVSMVFGQITTGSNLPMTITTGLEVSIQSGAVFNGPVSNEGSIEFGADVAFLSNYSGTGSIIAVGASQSLDFQSASISDLVVAGGDKTLLSDVNIDNLTFSNARILVNDRALAVSGSILGADANSHIVGKLIRSGEDALFYPIANNNNGVYAPVTLSNISGIDPKISIESFETNPLGIAGKGLLDVSNERYWQVATVSGDFASGTIELPVINELLSGQIDDLTVAKGSVVSGSFRSLGNAAFSGNLASGTIRSEIASNAGLYSLGLFFDESLRVADSLALVSLYQNTKGQEWINRTGWLTGSLDSWSGLTLTQKRVSALNLSGNNMQGTVPEIGNGLESLTNLNLRSNELVAVPNLTRFTLLTNLELTNNRLEFGSLEPNVGIAGIQYSPQKLVGKADQTLFEQGQSYEINRQISGGTNTYAWFKEDKEGNTSAVPSNGGPAISVPINSFDDEGYFYATVTNPVVPGLELTTQRFFVKVSSLERDRVALMELFEATNGNNWTDRTSWGSATVTNSWSGVSVENSRVTRVELPENGLNGPVPESFADIAGLRVVDLSKNGIDAFPDVSGLNEITSLNISQNRLLFKDIIPNKDVTGVNYFEQKRFGETVYDTLDAGDNFSVDKYAGIDFGAGSTYQWNFGPLIPGQDYNPNVAPVSGALGKDYLIENININSQGTYRLHVTNPDVPGLTIESRNLNILAKTDFIGAVTLKGVPVGNAEVIVYRQTPVGPFIKEDSTFVDASGNYILDDVVLGTFIVVAKPDRITYPTAIQTYHESAETYAKADRLVLEGITDGVDIGLLSYTPQLDGGTARISGVMESEFDDELIDEEDLRVNSRRKVKKAACSMRRFKIKGRDLDVTQDDVEEEIAYYVETDDEGYFNFEDVEDGKYLMSIEFPGIPVDPDAQVVFEIGGDRENQVIDVNVLITESGISVEQTEILYTLKPYLKNIVMYPNPTEGIIALDYTVYRNIDDLKMQLISTQGLILVEKQIDHWLGERHAELDLTDYGVGVYYLVFTDKAGTFRQHIKVSRK